MVNGQLSIVISHSLPTLPTLPTLLILSLVWFVLQVVPLVPDPRSPLPYRPTNPKYRSVTMQKRTTTNRADFATTEKAPQGNIIEIALK